MRRPLGLAALGFAVLLVQGAAADVLPYAFVPDLALLVVVGIGVAVGGAEGLALATLLGYARDLLGGALLGQHALLAAATWAATRLASGRIQVGFLGRSALVAALAVAYDLGSAAVTRLFGGALELDGWFLRQLAIHALWTGALAGPLVEGVARASARLSGEEDVGRRLHVDVRLRGG